MKTTSNQISRSQRNKAGPTDENLFEPICLVDTADNDEEVEI